MKLDLKILMNKNNDITSIYNRGDKNDKKRTMEKIQKNWENRILFRI